MQVRLKREHLNIAKFEPEYGLDPMLDLVLVGSEWQFRIQGKASNWQDKLVVTSTRSVEQEALSPTEVRYMPSSVKIDYSFICESKCVHDMIFDQNGPFNCFHLRRLPEDLRVNWPNPFWKAMVNLHLKSLQLRLLKN